MPLTEQELLERDAKRDIGEELLQAIRDVKAGRYGAVYEIAPNEAAQARLGTGLSETETECRARSRSRLETAPTG